MGEWHVFRLNDCDWYVARTLEEAKKAYLEDVGPMDDEDAFYEPHQISEKDLDTLTICDFDDPKQPKKTFRQYLDELRPTRAQMFASTEY